MKKIKSLLVLCLITSTFVVVVIHYRHIEEPFKMNRFFCVTGIPCTYPDVTDFRVIVITFKRPHSLSKLLGSLNTLVLDGYRAALEIWIDRDRSNNVDQSTLELASSFRWKGGFSRVHVQVMHYSTVCNVEMFHKLYNI